MFVGAGAMIWAVGNILGGIAIQTVVLVALDAFGVRGSRPLTYRAASLVLVLEAALVVAVLAIVIGGTQLPATLITARLTPAPVLTFGLAAAVTLIAGVVLERSGDAIADHVGPSGVLFGATVLPAAQRTDIYLTALGIVLTLIYAAGLVFRPRHRIARLGVDSLAVVIPYGPGHGRTFHRLEHAVTTAAGLLTGLKASWL